MNPCARDGVLDHVPVLLPIRFHVKYDVYFRKCMNNSSLAKLQGMLWLRYFSSISQCLQLSFLCVQRCLGGSFLAIFVVSRQIAVHIFAQQIVRGRKPDLRRRTAADADLFCLPHPVFKFRDLKRRHIDRRNRAAQRWIGRRPGLRPALNGGRSSFPPQSELPRILRSKLGHHNAIRSNETCSVARLGLSLRGANLH